MKKSLFFAGVVVAILAAVSCQKEQDIKPESANPEEEVIPQEPEAVFTLAASQATFKNTAPAEVSSKTSLDGVAVNWAIGDQIMVNGVTSRALTSTDIEGTKAYFQFDEVLTEPYRAVYPASAYVADSYGIKADRDTANVILPTTQNVTAGKFDPEAAIMIGKGSGNALAFEHAMVYLKFTFDQPIKSVRVMSNSGVRVRGRMKTNFTSQALENYYNTWNYNTVTADCGSGIAAGQPVIIAIPPKNYSTGLNFFVITADNKYRILKTGAWDISTKAGYLETKDVTLSGLADYQGPGIYCEMDWNSFVCADESKFTSDVTQQEDASAWKGSDGEINIYNDFTVATNIMRHGVNYAKYPDADNNIYFTETLDGNNHTITQNASTVPLVAWLGTATTAGVIKNLTLAGSCTEPGNWGNAAFAVRIFRKGVLDHCINRINTTYTETEASHSNLYLMGLACSNGGTIQDCENAGDMDITLLCDANRVFQLGGVAGANRYETSCGDFIRCVNSGNITVIKNASGTGVQCLSECGIAGICGTVLLGAPGTEYTGAYSRFVSCSNSGTIKFYEEKSGTASSNQLAVAIGGIIGISTKYSSNCPYVGANDTGYYFILDNCFNTGTLDVSSANTIQPLANNMSGARETYIGGLVGFAMGSNNPATATNSDYYPLIRGYNNSTIKLGSEGGSEAAGALVGGGGFLKFEYVGNTSVVYAKSDNPGRTPTKVGGVSAFMGWIVKRCVAVPTSTVTFRMDASGLNGLTVYGEGVTGVTGYTSKNASGKIDGKSVAPPIIFENYTVSGAYQNYNFALKYSDGSTEAAASLASGYQAASKTFYGKATTSGTYLRRAGNVQFIAW